MIAKREIFNLPNTHNINAHRCGAFSFYSAGIIPVNSGALFWRFYLLLAAITDLVDGYIARKYNIDDHNG